MPNVICLGELLIDLCSTDKDASLADATTFKKAPGGAPANVAVGLVRLGETAGFIGAVGDDPFGEFLEGVVRREGVDTSRLVKIEQARTSLAFIASRSDGRKDIMFYRNPGADMFLAPEHIDEAYFDSAEAFHFGSISMNTPLSREATQKACLAAQAREMLVTYDPNWRETLWPNVLRARDVMLAGFEAAGVAKVSDEEWQFITGTPDFARGAAFLMELGPRLIVRSEGPRGASYATARASGAGGTAGHVDGFKVDAIEPTGAGDGFMACLIVELLAHWRNGRAPDDLPSSELARIVRRANAVGALATTKVGAIPSLPTCNEVDDFLK